jgi:penicillin-binding protein 1C
LQSVRRRLACLLPAALLGVAWGIAVARQSHFSAPAPTPFVTDRSGAFLAQFGHVQDGRTEYGFWLVEPPPRVVQATLALEDRRFWQHPGVDPQAVARAAWQHLTGHGRSGASTIAMQVARLQNPRPRTLWAKSVEAGTAIVLTLRYGRAAVLAQYLRLAPYANGSHGIAHAARLYFDKPLADLGWPEIALLAALPQAPGRMNPLREPGRLAALRRADRILAALADAGTIAIGDLPDLRGKLPSLAIKAAPHRPDAPGAILRLDRTLTAGIGPPLDPTYPRIAATLDLDVQRHVTRSLREALAGWHDSGARDGAVMVVKRHGREVLASVSSAGLGVDFTHAARSPGSTLKPFLYALAFDRHKLAENEILEDRQEGLQGINNADGQFLGPLLPRQALANSRNVPAALLLRRVGLRTAFDALRSDGLHDNAGPASQFGLAMAIGALPSSLDRLVRGYAMLADGGELADLTWLRDTVASPPRRVLGRESAQLVGQFLSDPMARLPSFPRYGSTEFPFPVALKTGTSQGYRDAWTLAWSHDYVVGVWIGRADAAPMHGLGGAQVASLAHAILLDLHGGTQGDLVAGVLPTAPGSRPLPQPRPNPVRLSVISPEPNTRIWRNPEAPPAANRLVLKAASEPRVAQVVWLVDGAPAATLDPARPFLWPMETGAHRFQIRLPFSDTASASVRVVVE